NAEKKVEGAFPGRPLVEAGVRHALAVAFDSQGRHADARRHAARSLDLRRSALGPEHPDTLTSAAYLAYFLLRLGRTQEALELNERTLEARRRVLGDEHADTLFSMNIQVYLLQDLGELDEARTLAEQALEARRRTLG